MTGDAFLADEVSRYRRELVACVRLQDPGAYRGFVQAWCGLIQRGAAERLLEMNDDALAVRLANMALDDPDLADVHSSARATLRRLGASVSDKSSASASQWGLSRTVRLRRPRR